MSVIELRSCLTGNYPVASCVSLGRGRREIPLYSCAFIEGVGAGVSGYSSANPLPDFPTLVPIYSKVHVVRVRLAKELNGASNAY